MSLFSANKLNDLIDRYKVKTGRKLTIRELAAETSVSPAYLTLLKNGQRNNPSMDVVIKLSHFFNIAPEELLDDQEAKPPENVEFPEITPPPDSQAERTLELCEQMISAHNSVQALDLLALLEHSVTPGTEFYTDLLLSRAKALMAMKRFEESMEIADACLSRPITQLQQAKAYNIKGRIQYARERYAQAISLLLQTEELARACNAHLLLYQTHYLLGICFKETHDYGSSIFYFESAKRRFPDSLPILQKGHLLMGIGNTYLRLMSAGAAMQAYQDAETIYKEVGDTKFIADIQHNIARVKMLEQQFTEGIDLFEESLKKHQQVGDHLGIAADLLEIAQCYKELQQWEKVREYAFRASVTYENGNMQGLACQAKLLMVEALLKLGQVPDDVVETLDQIIEVFTELEWQLLLANTYHLKANLMKQTGHFDEALSNSMQALELYRKHSLLKVAE